jgi:hypothetical protein
MKGKHHSIVVMVAADLVEHWKQNGIDGFELEKVADILTNRYRVDQMSKWAKKADHVTDLFVDNNIVNFIVERVSSATSFQHFAYCGSMGVLKSGKKHLKKYDGYDWDLDQWLTWYEELANISTANVEFNVNCLFSKEFWTGGEDSRYKLVFDGVSPGVSQIKGNKDWDDQQYPSALDLAEFYEKRAKECKAQNAGGWSLQSLCYGIHMLQDMSVPQHILCTIENHHAEYENDVLGLWKNIYSGESRSARRIQETLQEQIGPIVEKTLQNKLSGELTMRQIGEKSIDMTMKRMENDSIIRKPNKIEAMSMTCQAIACTLKAIEQY